MSHNDVCSCTVEEYLRHIGRCVEDFEPPTNPKEQFDILKNETKILDSLQVKYPGMRDFMKFIPNERNYHQFNALETFNAVKMHNTRFRVKANHSNGGIFIAIFYEREPNVVEYVSENNQKTEFKFEK